MACEIVESKGAVFVLWGRPTKVDVARAVERLRSAVDRCGGPVVFITRVPDGAPPPDPAVQRYLNELMPTIVACCSSYHVVLEGAGFMAALKRGVLVGMFQIGQRRGMFHVHATCDEVVRLVGADKEATIRSVLSRARSEGLLDGNPLLSFAPRAKASMRKTG
jgi:hypothetical protein